MTLEQENKILKEHLATLYFNLCFMLQKPGEEVVDPDGYKDRGLIKYGKLEIIDYLGRNHSEPANFEYCYNNTLKSEIEK
jgi:hypothetical protein